MRGAALCECGCGDPAPIATKTNASKGHVKGEPTRFVNGHQMRGHLNGRWNGGQRMVAGYRLIWTPGHAHADRYGYVPEHRLVAESALGRVLDLAHPVHHVNEDRIDNRPANLVVCEDHAYHMILHQRARALAACGNADWLRCKYCKIYDTPENLCVPGIPERMAYHRECDNAAARGRRTGRVTCAA